VEALMSKQEQIISCDVDRRRNCKDSIVLVVVELLVSGMMDEHQALCKEQ
jgi:hypothetical protein